MRSQSDIKQNEDNLIKFSIVFYLRNSRKPINLKNILYYCDS